MNDKKVNWPVAATIAGSDSGGGAGIQADLKVFFSMKVHGVSAITALTAQNPKAVLGVDPVRRKFVLQQLTAIWSELPPESTKTGMLFSKKIVGTVSDFLREIRVKNLVVDPVMIATSGARLISPEAVRACHKKLFPLATLITPNLDEASMLVGSKITDPEGLRKAARILHEKYGCAVLLKGGHLKGLNQAIDIFFDGKSELLMEAPFFTGVSTHGTGCTFSAFITAGLALGRPLSKVVVESKKRISESISRGVMAKGHFVLNPRW